MSYWLPWAQNSFLLLDSYSSHFSIHKFRNIYVYAVNVNANSPV